MKINIIKHTKTFQPVLFGMFTTPTLTNNISNIVEPFVESFTIKPEDRNTSNKYKGYHKRIRAKGG